MNLSAINPTRRKVLISSIYAVLCIGLCISFVYCFKSFNYTTIYVDGSSMNPTFVGDRNDADYGVVEKDNGAKRSLKRYQIVTAHYPWDSGNMVVIKRVLFLPGDTFRVNNDAEHSMELFDKQTKTWKKLPIPFERNLDGTTNYYPETTLKENEYIIAGDNWANSSDCFDVHQPVTFDDIIGVVVRMEGRCEFDPNTHSIKNCRPYIPRYFYGVDY